MPDSVSGENAVSRVWIVYFFGLHTIHKTREGAERERAQIQHYSPSLASSVTVKPFPLQHY